VVREDEVDGILICVHLWGRRKKACRLLRRKRKKRKHLKDLGVNGRILNGSSRNMTGWRDWISHAEDRDKWLVLVNTAVKLQVP
jgi:hypothetical protein